MGLIIIFLISGCSKITSEQDQITKKAIQCYYNRWLSKDCSFDEAYLVDFKVENASYLVYVDIPNYKCGPKIEEKRCMRFEVENKEECPKRYVVDFCKNQTEILAKYDVAKKPQR